MTATDGTAASPAEELASFAIGLDFDDVPEEAIDTARTSITDAVGVTLAGVDEEPSRIAREYVERFAPDGGATVLGDGTTRSPQGAALANGVQGHAIDYDDVTYYTFAIHPSVTIVPTLLAAGEVAGASGRDLLSAFVAAFEFEIRAPGGIGGELQANGYHPTGAVGTFGATTAAARLLGLSEAEFRHALGIAGSLYSGAIPNFGTMTKPLHAGIANHDGLKAALLAEMGFGANDAIFDEPTGPWPYVFDGYDLGGWTADLGEKWYSAEGIGIKIYPSCGCTHGAIDAARAVHDRLDDPRSIESVTVRSIQGARDQLVYHDPETPLEAKFSMEYCVAAALLDGDVTLEHFEPGAVPRDDVRSLVGRTAFEADDGMAPDGYVSDGYPAAVSVTTAGGETVEETVRQPSGTPPVEVTDGELEAKFAACAGRALDDDAVAEAFDRLGALEGVEDVNELTALLSG